MSGNDEISHERKLELVNSVAYSIERYIDKKWIIFDAIDNVADNAEEREFLLGCNFWVESSYG